MPKKKSKEFNVITAFFKLIGYIFKGIYYIFKYIFLGIKYLIKKKKKQEIKQEVVKKGKLKEESKPRTFKVLKSISGNFNIFLNKLFTSKSTIGLILGARGTGKSAIGMCLLEQFKAKTDKKIYAMGFNAEDLPDWINITNSVDEI